MEVIPVLGRSTSAFSWGVSRTWHVTLGFCLQPVRSLRVVSYGYREQLTATGLLVYQDKRASDSILAEHRKTIPHRTKIVEGFGNDLEEWLSRSYSFPSVVLLSG